MPYSHYMHKGKKAVGASTPKGVRRKISSQPLRYQGAPKRGAEWDKRMMNDRGKEVCRDVENFIKKRRQVMEKQEESKIELIKEFIETCPLLNNGKINVDYLKDDIDSYSIDQTPVNPIVKQYTDGGAIKQIAFDFSVTAPISSKIIINLANSKFCEDFLKWIETQNREGNLPKIKGVQEIKCTSPRIYITKNRNNGNIHYSNELPVL